MTHSLIDVVKMGREAIERPITTKYNAKAYRFPKSERMKILLRRMSGEHVHVIAEDYKGLCKSNGDLYEVSSIARMIMEQVRLEK